MKLTVFLSAIVLVLTLTSLSRGQAVVVDDPGFQSPDIGSIIGGLQEYNYESATPDYINGNAGWYVSAGTEGNGSVTLVNQGILGTLVSPITGDASSQYLALNGLVINLLHLTPGALGGISQVVATTVGQSYEVDYLAGALSVGVVTTNTAQLSAGVDGVTVTSPSGGALLNLGVGTFNNESFTFTAASTQSTLDFFEPSALAANVGGVAIDNISIVPVPEPSRSAALGLGCILTFALIRRAALMRADISRI